MKYEIELWNRNNQLMADVSRLSKNRRWSRQRNEAETLEFSLNIDAFEKMAATAGASPYALLEPYAVQFRLKRNGSYLFGGEIATNSTSLDANTGNIDVKCWGYLNMFKDRYVTFTYEDWFMGDIAWDLINTTQFQTRGSQGVTRGSSPFLGVKRDRTYERVNVKDALIAFTNLSDQTLDFAFRYDKVFNTYNMIGSYRPEMQFIYPQNIISVSVPREATNLFNKIYGVGSGFGEDQIQSTQEDSTSESIYGIREKIQIYNNVTDINTLAENTRNYLGQTKGILEIPQIAVRGDDIDLNVIIPGDRVPVQVQSHKFLANIDDVYRIERIEASVDDNDEEQVRLYFDNYGL